MTTVLALDIYNEKAKVLAIQAEPGEPLRVLRTKEVPLPSLSPTISETAPGDRSSGDGSSDTESVSDLAVSSENPEIILSPESLESFQDLEIDSILAVAPSAQVLYAKQVLPFRDSKKIEQVAGIQVQDSLPFEIDEFVLDSVVLGESSQGGYQILSSLSPKSEVAATLAALQGLGVDPKLLTTRASALGNLALFCQAEQSGLNAYILVTEEHVSFAAIRDRVIVFLRDIVRNGSELDVTVKSLACSILQLEQELGCETEAIHVIAQASDLSYLRRMLFRPVVALSLENIVQIPEGMEISPGALASVIGAASVEFLPRKRGEARRFVDFRQGSFAYRRAWIALWSALKEEIFYLSLAILLLLSWFGGRIYLSHHALTVVNDQIASFVSKGLPGESVPKQGESSYLQAKLDTLEEELRGMGSLSSLSPLESLKELVAAVGSSLDVMIDSVSIGYSKMTIRGSVADNLSIGNFSTALKARKDRFCDVKVDPKGKTADNRVGFSAEIEFCE